MKLGPMARGLSVFAGLAILPILAACGQGQDERTEPAQSAPVIAEPVPSPTVAAPAPAAPAPAAPLRTSAGPRGSTVDLMRVQVTGSILTVEMRYTPAAGEISSQWYFNLGDVSVIDDATSQRYAVLQDDQKKWMAAPLSGGRIGASSTRGQPAIIWMKFPAPPATSSTISLNVPDVSPFDGVPVQR